MPFDSNLNSRNIQIDGRARFIDTQEDDNTFLPPALSSYSIALLNEKTKPMTPQVAGIYALDFPENRKLSIGGGLKNRLSAHFKPRNTGSQRDSHAGSVPALNFSNATEENGRAHGEPFAGPLHFLNNENFNNIGEEVKSGDAKYHHSQGYTDANRNNSSTYNSYISLHNNSTHANNSSSELNNDIMDSHTASKNATSHTPVTMLGNNNVSVNAGNSSNVDNSANASYNLSAHNNSNPNANSNSNMPPSSSSSQSKAPISSLSSMKRVRGPRRFRKVLGPPKRAVKRNDFGNTGEDDDNHNGNNDNNNNNNIDGNDNLYKSRDENDINLNMDHKYNFSDEQNLESFGSIKKDQHSTQTPFSLSHEYKAAENNDIKIPNPDSSLYKTLKKMKSMTPENDYFNKIEENKAIMRRRTEEQGKMSAAVNGPFVYEEGLYDEVRKDRQQSPPMLSEIIQHHPERENISGKVKSPHFETKDFDDARPSSKRIPLNNISNITSKKMDFADNFRKPKPPKQIPTDQVPISLHKDVHSQESMGQPMEATKKKKCITIGGHLYEKLELIGRGGSSKVYKVRSLITNRILAIKKVTYDQFDEACVKGFKGEIDLLLKLKNANRVVELVDYAMSEGSIYLVMECGEIDLAHVLQNRLSEGNALDYEFVKYHSIEVLRCVQAVHDAGIVHSDLKPANFLFMKGTLKIIDFGIANAVPDHTANIYRESQIGTPNYMAPEALVEVSQAFPGLPVPESGNYMHTQQQKNTWKVGKPSDVWSCGCIIYQMIYGKPPYGGYSGNQRVMAIMNPQVKIQYPNTGLGNVKVPQSAIELMQKCLLRNPHERWTVEECLNSDFLKPKVVSEPFIKDLVHLAVNFGYNNKVTGNGLITSDVYDKLVDTVIKQIENLNY